MARYGEVVLDQLEKFVEEVEAETSVEVVVVLAHRSERYPDLPFKVGSLAGLLALVAVIFLPFDFMAELLLLDVALAFAFGFLLGRFSPVLTRFLTTAGRRKRSVIRSARASFTERGISLTRERTGLLVYISWLERRVEILADIGVERAVPLAEWNRARRALVNADLIRGFPASLAASFAPLRVLLGEHLPPSEDNPDEIPNRPVVI